jgi:hypothetical protein
MIWTGICNKRKTSGRFDLKNEMSFRAWA